MIAWDSFIYDFRLSLSATANTLKPFAVFFSSNMDTTNAGAHDPFAVTIGTKDDKASLFSQVVLLYPSSFPPSMYRPRWELRNSLLFFLSNTRVFFLPMKEIGVISQKKESFLYLPSVHSNPNKTKEKGRNKGKTEKEKNTIWIHIRMGRTLQAIVLFLILLQAWKIAAQEEEWKSATATYTKETDGSIIIEGACGYGDLHKASYGKHSAGLSTMLFNRGSTCGACFELRCVDHILWCLVGSPSVILTATDFCPPNYGLSSDYGGWCNFPKEHFEMSEAAFAEIAEKSADIVPVQYRRVKCARRGGLRFTVSGSSHFYQVLVTNVGMDGEVIAMKVKGSKTGWIPMARNWGQNWQCNVNLRGQPLSFEVTTSNRKTLTSYNVALANWQFGQTYEGKQF